MKKVLIGGCGGAPSEGVINSLNKCNKGDEVIGMGSIPTDVAISKAKRKYIVPYANTKQYLPSISKIISKEKPELIHFQNDIEVFEASKLRNEIHELGTKTYMPTHEVIDTCVNKYKSYKVWQKKGVKVPQNKFINTVSDLKASFDELCDEDGNIWLRSADISGGGFGALPTNDFEFSKRWIERYNGWGNFIAAEMLTSKTITWLSIWYQGELVVAQTRARQGWIHGNRTVSGVTGVTKVGVTKSDDVVTRVALDSIQSIDNAPHGIYGVDMAYDKNGFPNPTEINISRFFTTILFFTEAGLNMPKIFKDIVLHNEFPSLTKKINPLENDLLWLRGMDTNPRLVKASDLDKNYICL